MFNKHKNETIDNLRKSNTKLHAEIKELKKDSVIYADAQEILQYSYENDILNLGHQAVSIKRQQLTKVYIYLNDIRIEYKHLFTNEDNKVYHIRTRRFEHIESVVAAYNRIVELLIDRPADKPVNPTV